jgi:hypothetical protein
MHGRKNKYLLFVWYKPWPGMAAKRTVIIFSGCRRYENLLQGIRMAHLRK